MMDFIARRAQKMVGNKLKDKWAELKANVLENPKDIIDSLVKQISKALNGEANEEDKKKAGECVEIAELMVGNLINVAASEGGQQLIGTIVDIYAQHAARQQVHGIAAKIEQLNEKMEKENASTGIYTNFAVNDDNEQKNYPTKLAMQNHLK